MKKFFAEFKKFISRGNVMDMAVGMIIGSAFTAIVTALSNGILKPIINWVLYLCCGGDASALEKMYTMLVPVYKQQDVLDSTGKATGEIETVIDLANSIYIDWGALISAIINFVLIALVLFLIVKAFNNVRDSKERIKNIESRALFKQEKGLKLTKKEQAALEEKAQREALEKAAAEEAANATPEVDPVVALLEEIRDSLKTDTKTKSE